MAKNELHAELLLGRAVHDRSGTVIGRIEEIRATEHNGQLLVEEFHLGPDALVERLLGSLLAFPVLRALGRQPKMVKLRWDELDFSDSLHLRLSGSVPASEQTKSS